MATQASTLSGALEIFNNRYQDVLGANSRRESDRYQSLQNQINSYFDIVSVAIGENNTTRAQAALDEIVAILVAEGITIADPVLLPLAVGVYGSPGVITVPVDRLGLNPVYTNALSTVYVFQGGIDASSGYTYSITSQTNVTAVIQNDNEIKINDLTADEGSVTVSAIRENYGIFYFTVYVYRYYDAQAGISINTYPSTILIPSDSDGSNPELTDAISTQIVREGNVDVTGDYTFTIQSETNVTAVIQNSNEVKINAITSDIGNVSIRASRVDYSDQDYEIPVQKQRKGQATLDGSSVDGVTIKVNTSDEGYVNRDVDGSARIFGSFGDLATYSDEDYESADEEDDIFRSGSIRLAQSPGSKSIEYINSINAYSEGNILIGDDNIVGFYTDDDYIVNQFFSNSVGGTYVNIYSSEGDLTAEFTVGKRLVTWVDIGTDVEPLKYYVSGTVTSSVYTSFTKVDFTPDFTISVEIIQYFGIYEDPSGLSKIRVVSSSIYGVSIDSSNNLVFGSDNRLLGFNNNIYGSGNRLNADNNLVLGNNWNIGGENDTFVVIGGGNKTEPLLGDTNLILNLVNSSRGVFIGNSSSRYNIMLGDSNAIGDGTGADPVVNIGNLTVGMLNKSVVNHARVFGFYGDPSTNGEIVLSAGSSPVQKSIFILEGETTSVSPTLLEALGRSTLGGSSGDAPFNQSIQMIDSTVLVGSMDIAGVRSNGDLFRRKIVFSATCDGVGAVVIVQGSTPLVTSISDYDYSDFTPTALTVTAGTNEIIVIVTSDAVTTTNWTCNVDVIVTDI